MTCVLAPILGRNSKIQWLKTNTKMYQFSHPEKARSHHFWYFCGKKILEICRVVSVARSRDSANVWDSPRESSGYALSTDCVGVPAIVTTTKLDD